MRPDERELDDEIRGHLALSVKERIERGEDPEAARLAALREFGYVPPTRDSMRRVWLPPLVRRGRGARGATCASRCARCSRAKGLAATVVVTLALGIGANAAIFSVVRGVLLRPLVNRDEDRLIYIRQSAPGIGAENTTFSVPEIDDLEARITTIGAFGDFSTVDFTMIGLGGEPRVVKAGVVGGSFFDVMGLRPVLGRLLNAQDDGPKAAGAAVLTYRFWTDVAQQRPGGRRQDHPPRSAQRDRGRRARAVGAVSGRHRDHRQRRDQPASSRRDDGDEPHASDDGAVRPAGARSVARGGARRADRGARRDDARASRGVLGEGRRSAERHAAARSDRGAGADDSARAARRRGGGLRHRVLERRQPDPGALGAPRGRAGGARRARRRPRRAPAHAAGREPGALRRRRGAGSAARAAVRRRGGALCRRASRSARSR